MGETSTVRRNCVKELKKENAELKREKEHWYKVADGRLTLLQNSEANEARLRTAIEEAVNCLNNNSPNCAKIILCEASFIGKKAPEGKKQKGDHRSWIDDQYSDNEGKKESKR